MEQQSGEQDVERRTGRQQNGYTNGKLMAIIGAILVILTQLFCLVSMTGNRITPVEQLASAATGTMLTLAFVGLLILPGLFLMHENWKR